MKFETAKVDEKEAALGVSALDVIFIGVRTAAVRRFGGEGGRGVNVGGTGHRPVGAGGPDEDLREESGPVPGSVDWLGCIFKVGDAPTPDSPKPKRNGVLPLGNKGSLVALGVDITSQPGSSSDGPKNDSGRLGAF